MRTFFLAFSFLLIFAGFSNAQVYLDYSSQETIDFFKTNKFISGSGNSSAESNIKGSPYLNDEFFFGSIYTYDKQRYSDIPLRYNIYNDDLEFKTPGGEVQALATPHIVELAVFGSTQMVYLPYEVKSKIKKGFFIIIIKGKASLYSKPGVMFKEATSPGAYKEPEPPKFVRKSDEYYLQFESEPAKLIGNKKELVAAFPDNRDKIKSFISKNKIKSNKPEDLKELIEYYNSL